MAPVKPRNWADTPTSAHDDDLRRCRQPLPRKALPWPRLHDFAARWVQLSADIGQRLALHCERRRRRFATFCVSKVDSRSRTAIFIDGDLVGQYVQIAEECCNQAMALGKRVHIFLRGALVVDEAGRALLRKLGESGAHLHAIGVYTSYILQSLNVMGSKGTDAAGQTRRSDSGPQKKR